MALAKEVVLDTYNPEITGFETKVTDAVGAPLTMVTGAGSIRVAGRNRTVPSLEWTYAANRDTYDDIILRTLDLGSGDGTTKTFSGLLGSDTPPIVFNTVRFSDGASLVTDIANDLLDDSDPNFSDVYNGIGTLQGDGTGSINYESGYYSVTFNTAPAAGTRIFATWLNVLHTPVAVDAVEPIRVDTSTRLQKVTTDDTAIVSVEKLAVTDWSRLRHVTGRAIQSRERNEDVSILEEKIGQLGNSIFDDGDIITGAEVTVTGVVADQTTGQSLIGVEITPGKIWMSGAVRPVAGATLRLSGIGEEVIGLRVIRTDITENQDSSLRNPATGFDGTGLPGAYREQVVLQWRVNDATATVVFRFFDGVPLLQQKSTVFSDINRVLERRTYNESGNYKVRGFRGSIRDRYDDDGNLDDFNMTLDLDAGLAYVQGVEIYAPSARRLAWKKAMDVLQVIDGFQFKPASDPTAEKYALQKTPVASVAKVSGLARTPRMRVTRQWGTNTDILPDVSVESSSPQRPGKIYSNIPNVSNNAKIRIYETVGEKDGTTPPRWTVGVHYTLDASGDSITWVSDIPPGGTTYYAFWNYDTDNGQYPLVKGTRLYAEATETFTTSNTSSDDPHNLLQRDIQSIVSVINVAEGDVYVEGVDYTWTSGRTATDALAALGTVTFKSLTKKGTIPNGTSVEVTYGYWKHDVALWDTSHVDSAEGDFLGVDSYLEEATYGTLEFPATPGTKYRVPLEKISEAFRIFDPVRDYVDLRPRGLGFSQAIHDNEMQGGAASGVGRSLALDGVNSGNGIGTTNVTYNYYLPRIDAVALKSDGNVVITYGTPAPTPRRPVQSEDVLRLLEIYSDPNSRSPRVSLASVTRTTMAELALVKRRMEELEVEVATTSLERDAQANAKTFQLRGIYTDPFVNFDFMDLAYDNTVITPAPSAAWAANTSYLYGREIKNVGSATLYARCIQTGTSHASVNPFAGTEAPGTVLTDNTCKWLVYARPSTPGGTVSERVYHRIAIDSLAGAVRFPVVYTSPNDELRNIIDWDQTTAYVGRQMVLLPFTLIAEIYQRHATEWSLVNPYSQFEPVMNLVIDPAADFWIETRHAPDLIIQLPGSTTTNLSLGYTGSHDGSGIVGDGNPDPVHPLPDDYAIGTIAGAPDRFHVGVPIDILSLGLQLSPGVASTITVDGHQAITVPGGGGDPDFWGFGFVPQEIRMSQRTSLQRVGDVVVDTGLVLYTRSRKIRATGKLFPTETDISCTFAGRPVALTAITGTAGTVSGTVQVDNNPAHDTFGSFVADFTIPDGLPLGNHEVKFTANGQDRIVTYIAHGQFETIATQYTSVTTTVYDVIGSLCPVAQSFIPQRTGYIGRIELWFFSKDDTLGIEIQIRNMVNGYPGPVVLGKVALSPADVNISNNASVSTGVILTDPVYVIENQEYCITVLDDSDRYRIWTARLGQEDVLTGEVVNAQPNIGVFFKSANNTTWTADQYVDMKFRVWFCDFANENAMIVFGQVSSVVASNLMLVATQFLPPSAQIKWSVSLDNHTFFPITPAMKASIDQIYRKVDLRAELKGAPDKHVQGRWVSPALNLQHLGFYGEVFVGEPSVDAEYQNMIEANYISENTPLTDTGFEELKSIIEEYRPAGTAIIQYFSVDDGATWIRMPNADNTNSSGVQAYSSAPLGGSVYEVVRALTFNPLVAPDTLNTADLTASTSNGTLASGTYYVRYAFVSAYGVGPASAAGTGRAVTGPTGSITFVLPTIASNEFPEDPDYPGVGGVSKPVNLASPFIKVYMSSVASGSEVELASSAWTALTSVAAQQTIRITANTAAVPAGVPQTVDNSLPLQFRTRLRLLAPYQGDLIPTPASEIPAASITYNTTGGTIPAGDGTDGKRYKIVYAFTNTRWNGKIGTTAASPAHDSADNIAPPVGTATNTINIPVSAIDFAANPLAEGARLFIRSLTGGNPLRVTDIEVVRDGQVVSTNTILPTDTGVGSPPSFRIKNLPVSGKAAPTTNTTGAISALAPQAAKYRVIVHDEALN